MVIEDLIKKILKEATTDGGGRGSYLAPLRPGLRKFEKTQLDPFNINVSNYDSPFLAYDSYDGKMNTPKKQIKKIETKAVKFSEYAKKHPVRNDDDGDNINPFPSKIGEWIEVTDNTLTENLAVWFGEKKKPKGSSQPKGPWVDICRKVNGKHPPCGRSDASEGSYPKCRAAGVAGKMSDSEKRNACQQKRKAEKNDPQSGKGQKPVMVSHKKKTNENMKQKIIILTENDITRIVRRVLKESNDPIIIPAGQKISLDCYNKETKQQKKVDGDIIPGETKNAKYGYRATIEDPTLPPGSGRYVETNIYPEEFIHQFFVESTGGIPAEFATPYDTETYGVIIEPVTANLAQSLSSYGIVEGDKILTHTASGGIKNTPEGKIVDDTKRYFCQILSVSSNFGASLKAEGVK